ncbi:prolyl oligopeptidase family serine peptidase [Paenibacillus sp. JX-17]|uniref:Prolyl oligopeptidase family serine peptidase n=1 Tax=Paenibacillus lacisoli TaxID=3064525 RepID=A0ABT9C8S4_9BACL|nr:prolyl oligopeptidase family serine peptidase [Paenibacillus sp. JX-17]MDO7905626.1 prolyl oligopeptidase family serine peptidase [Paenibacillus sp. JX-17]
MIYLITYLSDGFRVKGYLYLPVGIGMDANSLQAWVQSYYDRDDLTVEEAACIWPRKETLPPGSALQLPLFVYCRGGIGRVGRVRLDWLEVFAQHNSILFAPCYRGNEGGEGRDEFGGADQTDVVAGIELLQSLPWIQASNVSIMGFSRGSINAAAAAIRTDVIGQLVIWGGVSDLAATYEERVDLRRMMKRVIGGTPARRPEAYASRSPVIHAPELKCPVLIIHGTDDSQVDYSHGQRLYKRLLELNADTDMLTLDHQGHHLPRNRFIQTVQEMFAWIEQKRNYQ